MVITAPEGIKEYLDELTHALPSTHFSRLDVGTIVQKSWGLNYEIDDINLDRLLGDFPLGAIPYGAIYKALRTDQSAIRQHFSGSNQIPISRMINAGLGECLEKSVLVQLAAQRNRDSYLLNAGMITPDDQEIGLVSSHAYNIVFRDGIPYLVDNQNPKRVDRLGNVKKVYVVPIVGINEKERELILPENKRLNRTYLLTYF